MQLLESEEMLRSDALTNVAKHAETAFVCPLVHTPSIREAILTLVKSHS